jgi:hypothetical protein
MAINTHNRWGKYGHPDQVRVYRVLSFTLRQTRSHAGC